VEWDGGEAMFKKSYDDLNKIEQLFYDAYVDLLHKEEVGIWDLVIQPTVGIYRPDFGYGPCVVEIDGHEYHHTKEQREKDYRKNRYYALNGLTVVRFMGTEVYNDATKCVKELDEIACKIEGDAFKDWLEVREGK
jgi:very-short-patch-repair endonuclease